MVRGAAQARRRSDVTKPVVEIETAKCSGIYRTSCNWRENKKAIWTGILQLREYGGMSRWPEPSVLNIYHCIDFCYFCFVVRTACHAQIPKCIDHSRMLLVILTLDRHVFLGELAKRALSFDGQLMHAFLKYPCKLYFCFLRWKQGGQDLSAGHWALWRLIRW